MVLSATRKGIGGETFQISTSRETTMDEVTGLMLNIFENNGIERPKVVKTEQRLGDAKRNFSNTSKAKITLGWECEWQLEKGTQKTVEWFLQKEPSKTTLHS